mgnify:CR=1 FL=1
MQMEQLAINVERRGCHVFPFQVEAGIAQRYLILAIKTWRYVRQRVHTCAISTENSLDVASLSVGFNFRVQVRVTVRERGLSEISLQLG